MGVGHLVNKHESVGDVVVAEMYDTATHPAPQLPLTAVKDAGHGGLHSWGLHNIAAASLIIDPVPILTRLF
jgi:hypothetical protein